MAVSALSPILPDRSHDHQAPEAIEVFQGAKRKLKLWRRAVYDLPPSVCSASSSSVVLKGVIHILDKLQFFGYSIGPASFPGAGAAWWYLKPLVGNFTAFASCEMPSQTAMWMGTNFWGRISKPCCM